MNCESGPGTVHSTGCQCWEKSRNERLEQLESIARDWFKVMKAENADCTCFDGDACPLCRVKKVLGVVA